MDPPHTEDFNSLKDNCLPLSLTQTTSAAKGSVNRPLNHMYYFGGLVGALATTPPEDLMRVQVSPSSIQRTLVGLVRVPAGSPQLRETGTVRPPVT